METILQILTAINAATPGLVTLLPLILHPDGTVTALVLLHDADAQFTDNIKKAQEWLAANPKQ